MRKGRRGGGGWKLESGVGVEAGGTQAACPGTVHMVAVWTLQPVPGVDWVVYTVAQGCCPWRVMTFTLIMAQGRHIPGFLLIAKSLPNGEKGGWGGSWREEEREGGRAGGAARVGGKVGGRGQEYVAWGRIWCWGSDRAVRSPPPPPALWILGRFGPLLTPKQKK